MRWATETPMGSAPSLRQNGLKAPLRSGPAAAAKGWLPPANSREGARLVTPAADHWVGLAGRDRSAKIAPPAGPEAEGQPAWGARRGSNSASASTCAHLPRTTSSTFVAADETAQIRNEQRASIFGVSAGRGLARDYCYTSSSALVARAVATAANRGDTEGGFMARPESVRSRSPSCRRSVHTVSVTRHPAPSPTPPAPVQQRAVAQPPPRARDATHSAIPTTLPSHAQPLDVCARYGGHRVNFMRGHHAMWRCDYPRHR